jgi:CRP-like cAMP-binding protein
MAETNVVAVAPPGVAYSLARNDLLAALGPDDLALLTPDLGETFLEKGSLLLEPGEPIKRVYFPQGGLISLLGGVPEGQMIDTAMIGREGAIGLMAGLGVRVALTSAVVQIPGSAAYISPARLAAAAAHSASLRAMIVRYSDALLAQVQQVAVCNAVHRLEPRLCRWLVDASDRVGDMLELTQEHLAEILGVQRTTVTMICRRLQSDGVINVRRGRISVHNKTALETRSCSCARIAHRLLERHTPRHGSHVLVDRPGTRSLEIC